MSQSPAPNATLIREFGEIDIYLFDQLLRGRLTPSMRVLDAGCGSGRNLVYLLQNGFTVSAIDSDHAAVDNVRQLADRLGAATSPDRFRAEWVEALSFADASFDFVISSAVLHFARDDAHWTAMVKSMWRVLAPGGTLFARLASSVGQEGRLESLGSGRYTLPDGSARYLVDSERLIATTFTLGGTLLDPIKTSVVHGMRSMATWVVQKPV